MNQRTLSEFIKKKAIDYGFEACGITDAQELTKEKDLLNQWLNNNYHGEMHYMENHFSKRVNPSALLDGAKSCILFLHNYYPAQEPVPNSYKVSRYAYGDDYHTVLKDKLFKLLKELNDEIGEFKYKVHVDSVPILERPLAAKAGLGWIGKNGLLITPKKGSYHFISGIITDLTLDFDKPIQDRCGQCDACMRACPTGAIVQKGVVDARKCISYQTIEKKGDLDQSLDYKDWIFGCDICQEVCPWNKFSTPTTEELFAPPIPIIEWNKETWENISPEKFKDYFPKSPLQRTTLNGLLRNINSIKNTSQ